MPHFTLNGRGVALDDAAELTLLQALRGPLGLSGPRFGCGAESCGACHVLIDGESRPSCALPLEAVAGKAVRTVEGLGTPEHPHPLQTAFLAEQAGQCGYCLSGILVSAAALLETTPAPDEAAVRAALEPHLCRCGAQNRILRAVLRAAREPAA
ncbi:(2Fe-2S)-binding protein [Roseomonas sp. BN140053]|uniref:(2Fe-2S)-binding protein n=1 Tax=Roseomonas sp. BN140053 TaxID=3391898 RepID=UPI0039EA6668